MQNQKSSLGPSTLTRVSMFMGDLEKATRIFSPRFRPIMSLLGNTVKYGLYEENPDPRLIIVSQQIDLQVAPEGYTLIFTVGSDSQDLNERTARSFQNLTGILLKEAPEWLARQNNWGITPAYMIFKKYGSQAMESLSAKGEY